MVAGGASGMGVDRIGVVDDRSSVGQAARVYLTRFAAGYLAKMRTWRLGIRIGSDEVSSKR